MTLLIQIITETINNQNHQNIVHRRKQVVVNQHPENQTVFNRLPVVPGKSSYKDTADRRKFQERNISIFSDSIPKGIRCKEFNSYVKFAKARFFGFPGGNSKQLSSYIDVNLENSNSDTNIIHVGINDVLNGSNEPQIDSLVQSIGTIIEKCGFYGVKPIFISSLVYTARVKLSILEEIYKKFDVFCHNNGVIRGRHLHRDGLHLLESGKKILANNYITYLNKIFFGRTQHPEVYI